MFQIVMVAVAHLLILLLALFGLRFLHRYISGRFIRCSVHCPTQLAAQGQYEAPPRGWIVLDLIIRLIIPRLIFLTAIIGLYQIIIHDFELGRIPVLHSRELEEVPESESIAIDLHSRHRLEKRDILWLEQVRAADEDAARPVEESRFARSHRRRQQLVAQLLHVTERMQVEDDEVAGDSLESPVVVRSQQLPHTRHPDLTVDRRQQNRPVAGDAERP